MPIKIQRPFRGITINDAHWEVVRVDLNNDAKQGMMYISAWTSLAAKNTGELPFESLALKFERNPANPNAIPSVGVAPSLPYAPNWGLPQLNAAGMNPFKRGYEILTALPASYRNFYQLPDFNDGENV